MGSQLHVRPLHTGPRTVITECVAVAGGQNTVRIQSESHIVTITECGNEKCIAINILILLLYFYSAAEVTLHTKGKIYLH